MSAGRITAEAQAANLALAHLGEGRILSLADDHPAARACQDAFGPARDALLREADWNFASRRIVPARDPLWPAGRFSKHYPLPAQTLRVLAVEGLAEDEWKVVARGGEADADLAPLETMALACDIDAPEVDVVLSVAEPALWDPLFTEVFGLRLAMLVAPVLGKAGMVDDLEARAERRLLRARRIDAREQARSGVDRSPSWITSRR